MQDSVALVRDRRSVVERLVDVPHLARVVPTLPPELLHRVVQQCGLEACGEVIALATPAQLAAVFDLDLWRAARPGLDEAFDAERFGAWLEVLVEQSVELAARAMARLDVDLAAAALAQHVRVFDIATLAGYVTTDGQEIPAVIEPDGGLAREIAGRRIIARRPDAWDAIVEVLVALDDSEPRAFARLMRACTGLSNSRAEADGLDELLTRADQAMFDLASERQQRREQRGFASPADARAFLELSRRLRLESDQMPPLDPITLAHQRQAAATPAAVAAAMGAFGAPPGADAPEPPADAIAQVAEVLRESGITMGPPRALLAGHDAAAPPGGRLEHHLQALLDRDVGAYSRRTEELAWLANALMAGASIQGRPFTAAEAADAAAAVCSLGLENWPARWGPEADGGRAVSAAAAGTGATRPEGFLAGQDLVRVFQVGWTVLHDDVVMTAAGQLLVTLRGLPIADADTQAGVDALRATLGKAWRAGTPWRARDALDVLATLDLPAWTALLGLIAEYPVIHGAMAASRPGVRSIDPSAFVFISERAQVADIHAYLDTLPAALGG